MPDAQSTDPEDHFGRPATERQRERKRLRYKVMCTVDSERGVGWYPSEGYTDDLAVAVWHAERSPYPGWEVYDQQDGQWIGGDMPTEAWLRARIEAWIAELTRPGWALYPYLGGDEVSRRHREKADREALERYPDWKPAPEAVLAPLRVALYAAMTHERAVREAGPPGPLSSYPDGRDLEPGWDRREWERLPDIEPTPKGFGPPE